MNGDHFQGKSCLDVQATNPNPAINSVNSSLIASLPEYDIFVLGKLMAGLEAANASVMVEEIRNFDNPLNFDNQT